MNSLTWKEGQLPSTGSIFGSDYPRSSPQKWVPRGAARVGQLGVRGCELRRDATQPLSVCTDSRPTKKGFGARIASKPPGSYSHYLLYCVAGCSRNEGSPEPNGLRAAPAWPSEWIKQLGGCTKPSCGERVSSRFNGDPGLRKTDGTKRSPKLRASLLAEPSDDKPGCWVPYRQG